MSPSDKITLAEARKEGKLDQFIAEREGLEGDQATFSRVVRAMAGRSKPAPGTSKKGGRDG